MARSATRVRPPRAASRRNTGKAPSQGRSRATVDVILEATARVLGEHGYARTNTNLVARVAGVSVGSIYQYFPNKDALVAALHQRHSAEMHALFRDVVQRDHGGRLADAVRALVAALMAAHQRQAALHAVLEGEFPFRDTAGESPTHDGTIVRLLRDWLARHRAEITVRDLELAAHLVFESVVSLVHNAIVAPPRDVPPAALEAEIVALVMGYLSVKRPARARGRAG